MKTMAEVWATLADEYGQPMELVNEAICGLTSLQYTSKMEGEQFNELFRKWTEVLADLEEIGKTEVLNHEPTIWSVVRKLPSAVSRSKYVELRQEMEGQGSELDIMTAFMTKERRRQKALLKLESEVGETKKSSPKLDVKQRRCYNCNEAGHLSQACPKKSGASRSSKGSGSRVNACLKQAPVACPGCQGQHVFQIKGETMYKTRLSCCDTFRNLPVSERAAIVDRVKACQLCLEWTGGHQRDNCSATSKAGKPLSNCTVRVNGSECGLKHNALLHGSSVKYCNLVQVYNTIRSQTPGSGSIPSVDDLEKSDARAGANTLLQMQYTEFVGDKSNLGLTFWDSGSTINLIRSEFAQSLGLKGKPCVQYVQVSGHDVEPWKTTAYWVTMVDCEKVEHKILAYGVDVITAKLDRVDITPVLSLFPGLLYEEVYRPMGHVDLLVGIQEAGLHPTVPDRNVVDNLRLLESKFGTGKLLDGSHELLRSSPVLMDQKTFSLSHATLGECYYVDEQVKVVNHLTARKKFNFFECEEMAVGQPKRCNDCAACKACSMKGQELSRRDERELRLIKEGMQLDLDMNQLKFEYPLIKDPSVLQDNRQQAISMAAGLEKRLLKSGELEAYNTEIRDFLDRGVIREISACCEVSTRSRQCGPLRARLGAPRSLYRGGRSHELCHRI